MPESQVQPHLPLILAQTLPAEKHTLLRFSLLSALAHIAALVILIIWGGDKVVLQPQPQVITVDLGQMKHPRVADLLPQDPVQRLAAPARIRLVKTAKPQPAVNATKPQPVVAPRQTTATPTTVGSSQGALPQGIPGMPSGISSGTLSGTPSGIPSGAVSSAPDGTDAPAAKLQSTAATSVTASSQAADKLAIRTGYMQRCRALIERRKEYPVMARKGMIEGTVVIRGTLARDGLLRQCAISRSSGSGLLDNAAMRAVHSVGRFPPLPPELQGSELTFELPISFQLLPK